MVSKGCSPLSTSFLADRVLLADFIVERIGNLSTASRRVVDVQALKRDQSAVSAPEGIVTWELEPGSCFVFMRPTSHHDSYL